MSARYIAATFVGGPWNGSIRSIDSGSLKFDVMGSPREKLGEYCKLPGVVGGGCTAFWWEPSK